ncbi:LOW QUALITY PROTEIN: armadillo repeat-containing protein 7 [Bactrocera neohumeralis]|uniref:LOW QUALITY PROTEIN: armadillo repeat-containing protein 7 n=1 Tax=Bactrocera neohumeralis TaxID=98809 RepID=UPI0021667524|nr:LOW QUALITY PROTEIN: armadillo repeat-containing protein 7 [Bactrocera neohumeralis]
MFSSHAYLKRRTPEKGIPRSDYIEHLVEEYHTTTNIEAKEQVTANLANFAYDPINWRYLKESGTLDVFEDCMKGPNECLQLHAIAGYCNICLDPVAFQFITNLEILAQINNLLHATESADIQLNCIALLYQLLTSDFCTKEQKALIAVPSLLKKITQLRNESTDQRVKNIATLFCEDFGSRIEEVEDFKNVLATLKRFSSQVATKCREITVVKRFTQEELDKFSTLTSDYNPIHSTTTSITERKVHGAFLNAVVAGIIGSQIPGPGTIVLSQKFKFPNACRVDKDVYITVRLVNERKIALVEYVCKQDEGLVFIGEAKLLIKQ